VAILGTGESAATLKNILENDARLRSEVTAFFTIGNQQPDPRIPSELIRGSLEDLQRHIDSGVTNHVILSEMALSHAEMTDIIVKCEREMLDFQFVPNLFRILTGRVNLVHLGGVPLIGSGRWPLDHAGNRFLKRTEDLSGAFLGLLMSAPLIAIFMVMVKLSSPGPVFYRQERFGESGKLFTIYKLRTMLEEAESRSGPVWTRRNDPRRTRLGALMRRYNIDELPQLWNVLRGDMSLVGPRPERPQFVGQFKEDIGGYMWRHVYKPGMTGWAQVNGFRGDTGLEERIKHDLYYLEHWSLAFDFKILVKTVFARENAY
jgi:exopolysaccharide biosynthesis polyprenyl glycosylphosphotransferase